MIRWSSGFSRLFAGIAADHEYMVPGRNSNGSYLPACGIFCFLLEKATNLRSLLGWILTALVLTVLGAQPCVAADAGISARHNSWARFQPGAWKLVRVTTDSLDENGRVLGVNITETKTSLLRVETDGVVLEAEVGVEVAGKQFDGQPQCLKQGFHGELAGGDVKFLPVASGEVSIEERKVSCRTQQVEITSPAGRTTVKLFFSDTLSPYILRRQSKTTDVGGTNVLSETISEVVALDMPQRVLSELKNVACIKTAQKTPKGCVTTLAMSSPDVPGGVVYQTTKETDATGRLVRRSTLELLNFGTRPEIERSGLFGRKHPPRGRKATYVDGNWAK
jgi:hypothetical protein